MQIPKRPTDPVEFTASFGAKFIIKPLTNEQYDSVADMILSQKPASAFRLACSFGVVGWDLDTEFSRRAVGDLPSAWTGEIGPEIITISTLTETQKN